MKHTSNNNEEINQEIHLSSGHFDLFPIFEFVSSHSQIPLPGNVVQKEYQKIIKMIVSKVPRKAGWYLWGKFNDTGWWETIYLGRATKQKTSSLQTRLYDELREECIAFWSYVFGREPISVQFWNYFRDKYNQTRALRKTGSHFVIWVAVDNQIASGEIEGQESKLIKNYRPTHNAARYGHGFKYDQLTEQIESIVDKELLKIKTAGKDSKKLIEVA
jgi:hypothetical protein